MSPLPRLVLIPIILALLSGLAVLMGSAGVIAHLDPIDPSMCINSHTLVGFGFIGITIFGIAVAILDAAWITQWIRRL